MPPFAKLDHAYVVNSGDQLPVSRFLVLGKSPEVDAWSPQQDFWATCCEDPPEKSVVLVVRQIPSRSPRDLWSRLKRSLATFLFKPGFSFEDEPDVKSHLHVDSSRNGRWSTRLMLRPSLDQERIRDFAIGALNGEHPSSTKGVVVLIFSR